MKTNSLALLCLLLVGLPGCGQAPAEKPASAPAKTTITISAAASTKELVEALASEFEKTHDVKIQVNPGPSSGLAKQILSGAPVDLFLSASQQWADAVAKEQPVLAARPLLTNDLVLIVPENNPANVQTPQDLLSEKVRHLALAGESVPAGAYADQALTKLGLLDTLHEQNRIVRGQDVRSTLSYVERGEAEAGIVYATDVAVAPHVKQVYAFPADLHDEIVYVLVLLPAATGNEQAQAFFDFLQTPAAATIYRQHQFQPLPGR